MKLVDFLRARLDEDEAAARRAGDSFRQIGETGVIVATEGDRAEECASANWAGIAEHIVRHDPARVLADIEAKRQILAEHEQADRYSRTTWGQSNADQARARTLGKVMRLLALPYADHPDYRPEWKP